MFGPVQTPPEPHYPPKSNTKFEFQNSIFQNSIFKIQIFKTQFFKKIKNLIFQKKSNFYNSNFQNVDKI